MSIIEKIQKILDERGITPYKMCKETGIGTATYSSWKTKGTQPQIDKVIKIAEYLEISLDELAGIKKKEKREITKKQEELIDAYEKAPKNIKDIIDTALEPYKDNKKSFNSMIG